MTDVLQAPPAARAPPSRRPRRVRTGEPLRVASRAPTLGVVVLWVSLLVLIPLVAVVGKAFDLGWHGFTAAITDREAADALRLTLTISAVRRRGQRRHGRRDRLGARA